MTQITNKFYRFCLYLSVILCTNIFIISLLTIENRREIISGVYQNIIFVSTMILFSIALAALMVWLYPRVFFSQSSGILIAAGLFVTILVLQVLFLLFVSHPMQTSDAATVQNQSLNMLREQDGWINLNIPYFQDYSNNHFIVVFLYYFYRLLEWLNIKHIGVALIVFNVLCLDCGIFLSYLSVKKVKSQRLANYFLLLCMFCPTTYVWLAYVYTNTLSLPFVAGVLYLFLCIKEKSMRAKTAVYCVLWGFCAVVGYLFRPTTILPVIAVVLYGFMKYFQLKKDTLLKLIIVAAACLITAFSCQKLESGHIPKGYEDKAFPITHWIMMGLKGDGGFRREDRLFTESFETIDERKEANIKEIKKRLGSLGPVGYLGLVEKKLERVWGRGADDAFYKARYAQEYPVLYEYFFGSKNIWFMMYMQVFRAVTFFFICISILKQIRKRKCTDIFLFTLTLLGAIAFFILWEANPKYNLCFVYVCLLLMADGIESVHEKISVWQDSHLKWKKNFVKVCCGIALFSFVLGTTFTYTVFAQEKGQETHQIFFPGTHDAHSVENVNKTPWVQEQTLQVGQLLENNKWNRIQLFFCVNEQGARNRKEYRIEVISNPDRKILYHTVIGLGDLEKDNSYCIQYEPQKDSRTNNYSIRLTHLGSDYNFWTYVMRYPKLDMYPYGKLSINGEQTDNDLCFKLFYEQGSDSSKQKGYHKEHERIKK